MRPSLIDELVKFKRVYLDCAGLSHARASDGQALPFDVLAFGRDWLTPESISPD
jgi:hypothetical protein